MGEKILTVDNFGQYIWLFTVYRIWPEIWPEVQIYTNSLAVANGSASLLGNWKEKDWKIDDKKFELLDLSKNSPPQWLQLQPCHAETILVVFFSFHIMAIY